MSRAVALNRDKRRSGEQQSAGEEGQRERWRSECRHQVHAQDQHEQEKVIVTTRQP
jgi:hypothetical protein